MIHDTCGGIDLESARKEVFRFGVVKGGKHSLGVYGIGLKRSMFKLGSIIVFESDDGNKYFQVDIDVEEWKKQEGWNFTFSEIDESKNGSFTKISIRKLKDEVKREFESNRFVNELNQRISKTYHIFIKDKVDITVNGTKVPPYELEIAFSEKVEPAYKKISFDGIDRDSEVYAKILPAMQNMMMQYTRYMSRYYPSEKEETIGVDGLGKLTTKPIFEIDKEQKFKAPPPPKKPIYTTISYKKKKSEVDALKKCMGRPSITNKDLGERIFSYYKEMECSDDE